MSDNSWFILDCKDNLMTGLPVIRDEHSNAQTALSQMKFNFYEPWRIGINYSMDIISNRIKSRLATN